MEANRNEIKVKIMVFSGRPNPEFSLNKDAAEELASLVKTTRSREAVHPPPPPKLWDFNGFQVQTPDEYVERYNIPSWFSVRHGVLIEPRDREEMCWLDVDNVEGFLIDQATEQGYGDLINEFRTGKFELPGKMTGDQTPNDKSDT